jgi:predicted Rossmann fold flavoprotein
LVPLLVEEGHWLTKLSGVTLDASVEVRSGSGKRLKSFTNSTLITHFGLSGPGVLDVSRYFTDAKLDDPAAQLVLNWLPKHTAETFDAMVVEASRGSAGKLTLKRWLTEAGLPERLAEAVMQQAGCASGALVRELQREQRRALVECVTQLRVPVRGDRGYTYAEVTAGGVPLAEVDVATMESRVCPGLHLCGEVLDVDGRIGGFNFQWAWASGFVAGSAAAEKC